MCTCRLGKSEKSKNKIRYKLIAMIIIQWTTSRLWHLYLQSLAYTILFETIMVGGTGLNDKCLEKRNERVTAAFTLLRIRNIKLADIHKFILLQREAFPVWLDILIPGFAGVEKPPYCLPAGTICCHLIKRSHSRSAGTLIVSLSPEHVGNIWFRIIAHDTLQTIILM